MRRPELPSMAKLWVAKETKIKQTKQNFNDKNIKFSIC